MMIEIYKIYRAFVENKEFKVFFISPIILIISYILALILMNYERKKGPQTSTLLFTFWCLLSLTAFIRFRSIVLYIKKYSEHVCIFVIIIL